MVIYCLVFIIMYEEFCQSIIVLILSKNIHPHLIYQHLNINILSAEITLFFLIETKWSNNLMSPFMFNNICIFF